MDKFKKRVVVFMYKDDIDGNSYGSNRDILYKIDSKNQQVFKYVQVAKFNNTKQSVPIVKIQNIPVEIQGIWYYKFDITNEINNGVILRNISGILYPCLPGSQKRQINQRPSLESQKRLNRSLFFVNKHKINGGSMNKLPLNKRFSWNKNMISRKSNGKNINSFC